MKSYETSLPVLQRCYYYGIQGLCVEVFFTSIVDFFLVNRDWSLKGHSSVYAFLMFGFGGVIAERLYVFLYYTLGLRWHQRVPIYLCMLYAYEFSCGLLLRQFDACPWDYSHYRFNFKGLITLEYAPGWAILSYFHDSAADILIRIRVLPEANTKSVTPESSGKLCNLKEKHQENGSLKEMQDAKISKEEITQRAKN